ncbi:uncharacterized protein LOC117654316 [Thrips palmi]|uniref:Uncharacterized protein LOC117654316 n=1 Tax=Thrips palmi TaxID=161013 RepID=A0A6P9AEP9_THRPL|nr:uncharacterized protein LOC117654316 [Thrips palmi]
MIDTSLYEMHQKRYIQSFIKYRTNLCDYLRKENRPIFRSFKTYYKYPSSCPLVGYYKYDNRRFEDLQPPILPGPDTWKIVIHATSEGKSLMKETVTFHIERLKSKGGH